MMNVLDDLQKIIENSEWNVAKISRDTGISQDKIYKWIAGRGYPKVKDYQILEQWILKNGTIPNLVNEEAKILINKNPFVKHKKNGDEWSVIELLVQEIAIDRSRQLKIPLADCIEELYTKIDSVLNAGKAS